MKSEFALAINEIIEDKGLPREVIIEAIKAAMVSAYRKTTGGSFAQEITVDFDFEQGQIIVFVQKEVTDLVLDDRTEVLLEDARKVDPDCNIGDLVMVDSTPENFGRLAAQAARQAVQQKIRDAERRAQFDHFSKQVGEITNGVVQAINYDRTTKKYKITIGLDLKAEGVMLDKEMIPNERFRIHDRVRAYIKEVKDDQKGLEIQLSRASKDFLRRLLENEVPEIYHGIVEIRSIAREPGKRAKVAVSATQSGVDPVGACVGQRGVRIQAIGRELNDEKIDVIEWNPDTAIYISKAISPARVAGVYLNHSAAENRTATVVGVEEILSLAIGRGGENAKLAAKLTGWRIDILSIPEAANNALVQLRTKPDLADLAEAEAETMEKVQELLLKKEEGRPLSLDDNNIISRFVDRFERRGEEERKIVDARALEIQRLREEIDPRAFELNLLDVSEIKETIANILQAANIESFGDLLLQYKVDAEAILGFAGIGPKSYAQILHAIETVTFAEDEVETIEPEAETEMIAETEPVEEPELSVEDTVETPAEIESEEVLAFKEPVADIVEEVIEEEPEEEKSFEELLELESSSKFKHIHDEDDEEHLLMTGSKKKKSKKRKSYTIEYDPDEDQTYKQFKYRDDDWDNW